MSDFFKVLLRVRYSECDAQSVVFNARYGDYVDLVATEYLRALFGGYEDLLAQGIDNQVVRLAIDWKAPAKFDDVLAASVETLRVGNTSYTLKIDFTNHLTQTAIASAELTCVMVTPDEHQKMSIPDDFRARILAGANGKVYNYAGIE